MTVGTLFVCQRSAHAMRFVRLILGSPLTISRSQLLHLHGLGAHADGVHRGHIPAAWFIHLCSRAIGASFMMVMDSGGMKTAIWNSCNRAHEARSHSIGGTPPRSEGVMLYSNPTQRFFWSITARIDDGR